MMHANRNALDRLAAAVGLALLCAFTLQAQEQVHIRVLDVGPGLACVVSMPGGHFMVYDTGHWNTDNAVLDAVKEMIPEGSAIELLVQSHSDSDHLGATDEICDAYQVKRILRTGMPRTTATWADADHAIRLEKDNDDAIDINLGYFEYPPGATYRFGDSFVSMVFGLGEVPEEWKSELSPSEERNAVSIVIRLLYDGKSVLFCGDTVGRHIGDPDDACIAAEKAMVENSAVIPIDSDVIIAPHHGADNGSSTEFIEAVSPDYVIFSAGHEHEHPRDAAAQRYLDLGVSIDNMFRTDRGDNEGNDEWTHGNSSEADSAGDDDVDILLVKGQKEPIVKYRD